MATHRWTIPRSSILDFQPERVAGRAGEGKLQAVTYRGGPVPNSMVWSDLFSALRTLRPPRPASQLQSLARGDK
jgi:hypothetical protein